jgi:hypothetical protein
MSVIGTMNALSLKGFLTIASVVGLFSGVGIIYCAQVSDVGLLEVVFISFGSVVIGLVAASHFYLVQLWLEIRNMRLSEEDLLPSESVVMESPGTLVHCRTGRPARFWNAVGGKLFLTTHRLIFVTHRCQPWCYTLSLSLGKIAGADTCQLFETIRGGMRVTMTGGKKELFTFGAVRELEADRWAAAILLARYRGYPKWGTEEGAEPETPD